MFSKEIEQLFEELRRKLSEEPRAGEERAGHAEQASVMSTLTEKAGSWYEKIRNLLDYKEDHAVKVSAVRRILKRKLVFGEFERLGQSLLHELMRGGYLSKSALTPALASRIDGIVQKFNAVGGGQNGSWGQFLEPTAGEVYRAIFPSLPADLSAEAFFRFVRERIIFTPILRASEATPQTLLAARRSLLGSTDTELASLLWLHYFPEWQKTGSEEVHALGGRAVEVMRHIEAQLKNPLGWRVAGRIKNESVYFNIIRELLEKYGLEAKVIAGDQKLLEEKTREIAEIKYRLATEKARASGARAVFYVFATKIIFAFAVELPYDLLVLREVSFFALGVNVIFHPLFLFATTRNISLADPRNTAAIVEGVKRVVSGEQPGRNIPIKTDGGRGLFEAMLLGLYGLLFLISFGAVIAVLNVLNFNPASIALFIFFLALVTYFSFRIRYHALRWKVDTEHETVRSLLWDVFTLPIARFGRWLSVKFSSINLFVFIMDMVIEAPFKILLEVFDAFLAFLKEKKEEIR